jgi:uncharacterized repeat protein (TIGR02059 family)
MRKLSCICSLFLLIAISVAVSVTPVQKVSAFGGGAGSSVSPYLISTCAELFAIDDTTANLSASYVFTSNVDCSVGAEAPMPASGSTYFSGSLDGNNYELRGLNITCTSGTYCALFSQVTGNVVIKNLTISTPVIDSSAVALAYSAVLIGNASTSPATAVTISQVIITGGSVTAAIVSPPSGDPYTGSIVGRVKMGAISNSQSSATVTGSLNVGGLAGELGDQSGSCDSFGPNISGSSFSGSVSGLKQLGGLVGSFGSGFGLDNCAISNSFNTGNVSSASSCVHVGGIVGYLFESTVVSTYNTGDIGGSSCTSTGGVVGKASGRNTSATTKPSVVRTYSSGQVSGSGGVGGVVGTCEWSLVSESYSSGLVTATTSFGGGLVGNNYCSIQDSYSTGNVDGAGNKGGLVGQNSSYGSVTNSYSIASGRPFVHTTTGTCTYNFWDVSTGAGASSCATGKTTSLMKTQATFTGASWDFAGVWNMNSLVNNGYPTLRGAISDSVLPTLESGVLNSNGTTLVLTFSEVLRVKTSPASAFSVSASGSSSTPTNVSISGSTATLTLPSVISSTATVLVSYLAPTASSLISNLAVQDVAGNDAVSFSAISITNNSADLTVPTLTSGALDANGTSLVLTFSESLHATTAAASAFTVTASAVLLTPTSAVVNGSTVVLTLSPALGPLAVITVAYVAPASNAATSNAAVQDLAGNDAASFSGRSATNNSTADIIAPTASWTEPTTPSSSRILSYTLTFSEAVSGIAAGDFGTIGTATGCVITTASNAANLSVVITVTCSSDGTVTLRLRSGSVLDASSNTGPTSDALATAVTITSPAVTTTVASTTTSPAVTTTTVVSTTTVQPTGTTTTVTTAPSGTGVTATTVPVTVTTLAVGQSSISTVTTVVGNTNTSSTTVTMQRDTKAVGAAAVVTTTTKAPVVTTTTIAKLAVLNVPRTELGGSSVLIGGKVVEGVITRENNRLTITAGPMVVRIWAVAADGSKLSLDADGRLRVKAGDSVTVDATGFSFNTRVEVRLYSDPVLLGRTDVDDKGIMNASYEIPQGIPSGNHNVVLAGERDGSPVTMALSVALGEQSSGNALAVVFIGVLVAAGVTALMLPAFLRRRREDESGE